METIARFFRRLSRFFSPAPSVRYDYVLGLGETVVHPGSTSTVGACPNSAFAPKRLVLSTGMASAFQVVGVSVDRQHRFSPVGDVPGELFAAGYPGPELRLGVVRPGEMLLVKVRNTSSTPVIFRGAFVGPEA